MDKPPAEGRPFVVEPEDTELELSSRNTRLVVVVGKWLEGKLSLAAGPGVVLQERADNYQSERRNQPYYTIKATGQVELLYVAS